MTLAGLGLVMSERGLSCVDCRAVRLSSFATKFKDNEVRQVHHANEKTAAQSRFSIEDFLAPIDQENTLG